MKILCSILLLLVASQVNADLNAGLVAHYPFTDGLSDTVGSNADAVNVGASLTEDRFGNANSAYLFTDDFNTIQIPDSTVNGLVDYSISLWIKANDLWQGKCLISWGNSNQGSNLYLYLSSQYLGLSSAKNSWSHREWRLQNSIQSGNWQNVVLSRDSANNVHNIFVDGTLFESVDTTVIEASAPISAHGFVLGNIQYGQHYGGYSSGWQFKGTMSDLRIYNRAFTEADAQELFSGESQSVDTQTCINYLSVLFPGTITEDLTFPLNTAENEYYHHYDIQFNEFTYDSSCFETQVWLGNNLLAHEVVDNGIELTFAWKDAESTGCTQISPTEQQCQFQLHIYFQGTLQHQKLFTSTVTTPDLADLTQELNLNVINDEDESLKQFDQTIDTQLKFCADLQCSSYTTPSEIIRNTDVYVEFKVNTPGYNQYYPVHSRFTLNEFQVDIQNQAAIDSWAEQGRIIYHFRPPFASPSITLAVGISLSKTNPNRLRRVLQESDGPIQLENQKDNVGKYIRINVVEEENSKKAQEKDDKEKDNTMLYVGIIAGAVVLLVSLTGLAVWYKAKSQKSSPQKQNKKEKLSNSGDAEEQLNIQVE